MVLFVEGNKEPSSEQKFACFLHYWRYYLYFVIKRLAVFLIRLFDDVTFQELHHFLTLWKYSALMLTNLQCKQPQWASHFYSKQCHTWCARNDWIRPGPQKDHLFCSSTRFNFFGVPARLLSTGRDTNRFQPQKVLWRPWIELKKNFQLSRARLHAQNSLILWQVIKLFLKKYLKMTKHTRGENDWHHINILREKLCTQMASVGRPTILWPNTIFTQRDVNMKRTI